MLTQENMIENLHDVLRNEWKVLPNVTRDQKANSPEPIKLCEPQLEMVWHWDGQALKASWKSTLTEK